ncbi:MAG: 50S ribosomal protein L25/general stress protein Ctc [Pseudomonadales bacterium]|nr:50S ribosomal protein L25/general stress protein Ctc [Pseudomonadales bacterium]
MSVEFVLSAAARGNVGKGASRRLRKEELVPGIIYGGDKAPRMIALSHKDLTKALENEVFFSHLITLNVDSESEEVILKALQRHPSKPRLLHADFQRVVRGRKLHVHVPLRFLNEDKCHGVKQQGGMIQHNAMEVHVNCLPKDIPEFIEVDMLDLQVGDAVHLSELVLPEGVESIELMHGPEHDVPVASVHATKVGAGDDQEVAPSATPAEPAKPAS